jgi:hypothetical protein
MYTTEELAVARKVIGVILADCAAITEELREGVETCEQSRETVEEADPWEIESVLQYLANTCTRTQEFVSRISTTARTVAEMLETLEEK